MNARGFFALIVVFVVGIAAAIGIIAVSDELHPCVKEAPSTCYVPQCLLRGNDSFRPWGLRHPCLEWEDVPVACAVCVERAP